MDEHVDRAIDAALDDVRKARPSPDFLPRLRAHVEQQPRRVPIRWWIPFAASATAVLAGVVVAMTIRAPREVRYVPVPQPAAQAAAPQTSAAEAGPPLPVPVPVVKPARVPRAPRPVVREPQVLVPPGQREALSRFAAALDAGDAHALAMTRRIAEGAEPVVEKAVTVPPIEIAPVVVAPMKESL